MSGFVGAKGFRAVEGEWSAPGRWRASDAAHALRGSMRVWQAGALPARDYPQRVRCYLPLQAPRRAPPSFQPAVLDQASDAVGWLVWLLPPADAGPADARRRDFRVVGARLCGGGWQTLARLDGRSDRQIKRLFHGSMADLARRLEAAGLESRAFGLVIGLSDFKRALNK